jgi:hypothetical protein
MRHLVLSPLLFLVFVLGPLVFPSVVVPAFGDDCGGTGKKCKCGDTVTADTVLSKSHPVLRTVCTTNEGLRVAARVNLLVIAGTIQGPGPLGGATTGILIEARSAVVDGPLVIRTGVIRDFDIGVESDSVGTVDGVTLSNLQILDSGFFGIRLDGNGNIIDSNIVQRTDARAGIEVSGDRNVVRLNRALNGKTAGIVVDGVGNTVSRNIAQRNGDAAIPFGLGGILISGTGATVDRNDSAFNVGPGFDVNGSGHTVRLNLAEGNSDDGITVAATARGNTFRSNRLFFNGDFGIEDSSRGTGDGGTANDYAANVYRGNASGPSNPAGLP